MEISISRCWINASTLRVGKSSSYILHIRFTSYFGWAMATMSSQWRWGTSPQRIWWFWWCFRFVPCSSTGIAFVLFYSTSDGNWWHLRTSTSFALMFLCTSSCSFSSLHGEHQSFPLELQMMTLSLIYSYSRPFSLIFDFAWICQWVPLISPPVNSTFLIDSSIISMGGNFDRSLIFQEKINPYPLTFISKAYENSIFPIVGPNPPKRINFAYSYIWRIGWWRGRTYLEATIPVFELWLDAWTSGRCLWIYIQIIVGRPHRPEWVTTTTTWSWISQRVWRRRRWLREWSWGDEGPWWWLFGCWSLYINNFGGKSISIYICMIKYKLSDHLDNSLKILSLSSFNFLNTNSNLPLQHSFTSLSQ